MADDHGRRASRAGGKERFPLAKDARHHRPLAGERHLPARPVALPPPRGDPPRRTAASSCVDLGSKNGTLLNGEPRARASRRLRHGDVITLGEHILTFSERRRRSDEDERDARGHARSSPPRELSDIKTRPAIDPEELARQNRVLAVLSEAHERAARAPAAGGAVRADPRPAVRGRARRARRHPAARGRRRRSR